MIPFTPIRLPSCDRLSLLFLSSACIIWLLHCKQTSDTWKCSRSLSCRSHSFPGQLGMPQPGSPLLFRPRPCTVPFTSSAGDTAFVTSMAIYCLLVCLLCSLDVQPFQSLRCTASSSCPPHPWLGRYRDCHCHPHFSTPAAAAFSQPACKQHARHNSCRAFLPLPQASIAAAELPSTLLGIQVRPPAEEDPLSPSFWSMHCLWFALSVQPSCTKGQRCTKWP